MLSRSASHANDWYSSDASTLDAELQGWLDAVAEPSHPCKAIVAPHAGYSYSGPAAAYAYKAVETAHIKRVFILGPSHHIYLNGCALSQCTHYATPLGSLPLDTDTISQLRATGKFQSLSLKADEDEHSLEMHLPYIRKIFAGRDDVSIVPIMVGAIDKAAEAQYGQLLAPYLAREDTLCVVSSDFCHWGTRFSYTYYYPAPDAPGVRLSRGQNPELPIHKSISQLDHEGMDILTRPPSEAHEAFADYLGRTKNTICGRHPIGVLLGALSALEKESELKWVRYEQSSACLTIRDSSVSYASAWVKF
ncbi:MEMO1 family [Roridomyces roridus]|uniref:MEMO1 family n=1 Tax=Roridomyces roridus TaxID=1738132 RepID=A0AAD7BUK0_9AGAR|nr:MEMO1 family [Roridomyces roridus]